MTTTVTINASDFTKDGAIPAGAKFRFKPVKVNLDSAADTALSAKAFEITLDGAGYGSTVVPDAVVGNGLQISSNLAGWKWVWVAGYPTGTISLPDLINGYEVDAASLAPGSAPASWFKALKSYVKTVNGTAPDGNGNVSVSGGGGGGGSAIAFDTDGVPYIGSGSSGPSILTDTDGVPYIGS